MIRLLFVGVQLLSSVLGFVDSSNNLLHPSSAVEVFGIALSTSKLSEVWTGNSFVLVLFPRTFLNAFHID